MAVPAIRPRAVWLTARWMLTEEYRHHTSYSNRFAFFGFPFFTFIFVLLICASIDRLTGDVSLDQMKLIAHGSVLMYGMGMGAFTFFGTESLERRTDRRSFLIQSPLQHPLSFKEAFWAYFLHDVVFYIFLTIVPMAAGLYLSIPWNGFTAWDVTRFMMGVFMTFMFGLSLAFLLSSVYLRSRGAFAGLFAGMAGIVIAVGLLTGDFTHLLPALLAYDTGHPAYALVGVAFVLVQTLGAVALVRETIETRDAAAMQGLPNEMARPPRFPPRAPPMLQKEFLDLRRSRTVTRIVFSFVAPLLFITFLAWFINRGIEVSIGFNLVFYGEMVGFFGILTYSWLSIMDTHEFYVTLPVSVPDLVRTKIRTYLWITMPIAGTFLVIVGAITDQLALLPLAAALMAVTSVYFVCAVAYLTGLRPNSSLFNIGVLVRFAILSLLPMSAVTVLSIMMDAGAYYEQTLAGLGLVCLIMLGGIWVLYRGIGPKWRGAEFSI